MSIIISIVDVGSSIVAGTAKYCEFHSLSFNLSRVDFFVSIFFSSIFALSVSYSIIQVVVLVCY